MSYVSLHFLLFFLLLVLLYYLIPVGWLRSLVLLGGNLTFCILAGGKGVVFVMFGLTLVAYFSSILMEHIYKGFDREKEGLTPKEKYALLDVYKKKTMVVLVAGMVMTLSILFYVKMGRMLGLKPVTHIWKAWRHPLRKVYVPLGISYYTLSLLGYQLDVFWRKAAPEKNFLRLFSCTTFFPIIVEGPISRFDELCGQFKSLPAYSHQNVTQGMELMLWGFFKKLVVADRFAIVQNTMFGNITDYQGLEVVLAVLANVIVDYADFSGCIDIARGAAQVLGIQLPLNFRQPFFSRSASEFWRRWHMTLGAWFKDYLYMPLARSSSFIRQVGKVRKRFGARAGKVFSTAVPLLLVWFMTGLWHGTGWDYLLWGFYWGMIILLSMILEPSFKKWRGHLQIEEESFGWHLFQMVRTGILFGIGRMLTATGSVGGFITTVGQMFSRYNPWILWDGSLFQYGLDRADLMAGLLGVLVIFIVDLLQSKSDVREGLSRQPIVFRWLLLYACLFFILVFGRYGLSYRATDFMYGQF